MNEQDKFNSALADSQGTEVVPVDPKDFDIERYADYEASLLEKNRAFWQSDTGVAVYRRFRVPEVFSYGCRDMERSLAMQLAALESSMAYQADIANFLEPWYGIGTVASAFGVDYEWPEGQAPVVKHLFETIDDALRADIKPVDQTPIGQRTLAMIEYFLDKTKGKIPISLTDTQSPISIASYIIDMNNFFMGLMESPEKVKELLSIIADLSIDFANRQKAMIGAALANPGHGFASSRQFAGIGMSDDIMIMNSPEVYRRIEIPVMQRIGSEFGGTAFHSCGNWSSKAEAVRAIPNLVTVDGAFSPQTDPHPNPVEAIRDVFAGTGVVINARIVGNAEVVSETINRFCKPGIKMIAVTYCQSPSEQEAVYRNIHATFQE